LDTVPQMLLNMETFLPVDTDGTPKEKITHSLHKRDIKKDKNNRTFFVWFTKTER